VPDLSPAQGSLSGEWEVPVTRNAKITLVNEGGGVGCPLRDHLWQGFPLPVTVSRNWLSGQRRSFNDTGNVRVVGLAYGSWWDSFVGNILGRPGKTTGGSWWNSFVGNIPGLRRKIRVWKYTDPALSCDALGNNCAAKNANWTDLDIWKLGYDPERWRMYPDPQTLSTVIRDGNYDFLTNSQRWHNTTAGFAMPDSLYLKTKPSFFGSNPWPWVNPTNGSIAILPAKARFDNGTYFCNSGC